MKTHRQLPPGYLAKIGRHNYLRRVIFFLFRRYCLNTGRYRITCKFTGPRPRGTSQYSTLKENMTARRYYLNDRQRGRFQRVAY